MVTVLLYIPTRGFWTKKDAEEKGDCGNESRTKLKPPSDLANPVQGQIGAQTEEDTEGDPHLPSHHETTSNGSRCVFRGKDGDRGRFRAHTNAE